MRKKVLSEFLKCRKCQIQINEFNDGYYYNGVDYAVYTEDEANQEAAKHVVSYIDTLDIDFIISHLPAEIDKVLLKGFLNSSCDNCLNLLALFIRDYKVFVSESICRYGRAYFICFENKTEYAIKYNGITYYIYRLI